MCHLRCPFLTNRNAPELSVSERQPRWLSAHQVLTGNVAYVGPAVGHHFIAELGERREFPQNQGRPG